LYYEQLALALSSSYSKTSGDMLTAQEWNNLTNDFVAKSGDTMSGDLTVNGNITGNSICDAGGNCLGSINLWESSYFSYAWNDPTASNNVSLGTYTFCALSKVTHDGRNGGWCDVYKNGNIWYLNYGKWQGGGIGCRVICF
jgi:hypothetical protein